jgi:hypothetical protein
MSTTTSATLGSTCEEANILDQLGHPMPRRAAMLTLAGAAQPDRPR